MSAPILRTDQSLGATFGFFLIQSTIVLHDSGSLIVSFPPMIYGILWRIIPYEETGLMIPMEMRKELIAKGHGK
jgi:hypothetical protein